MDFEHGLNKAVAKIRRALDDDVDEPRYLCDAAGPRLSLRGRSHPSGGALRPRALRSTCRILWDSRTIPLAEGENLIGRDPEATVWVDSTTVSRRHAQIRVAEGAAILEDLGSKNGTYLRGRSRRRRRRSPTEIRSRSAPR